MRFYTLLSLLLALGLVGCGTDVAPPPVDPGGGDDDFALDDLSDHERDVVSNDLLPDLAKDDRVFPESYDVIGIQSPIKSQGGRGVCSIFSAVGYVESVYIQAGAIDPDFSEQFLQWSTKFESRDFTRTSGSNTNTNLGTVHRYGVVAEADWPYETSKWGVTQDAECDGEDSQPTRCYTNGEPPQSALEAQRFKIPRQRYIRVQEESIKAHIEDEGNGVVLGFGFYYQSWNHRRSPLPTSDELSAEGVVNYPNQADREHGDEKRVGHSIMIVGWDDNKQFPTLDEEGNEVVDADGNPVLETGYFLFKNSWGSDKFGRNNPFGAGYGWMSYRYLEAFGRGAYVIQDPVELSRAEVCNDGEDNDDNGMADCDDPMCASNATCMGTATPIEVTTNNPVIPIPDNDPNGVDVTFEVAEQGVVDAMTLTLVISHTYSGDLGIALTSPEGEVFIVADREGNGVPFEFKTYTIDLGTFQGNLQAQGTWTVNISDNAAQDSGQVEPLGVTANINVIAPQAG